MTNICFESVNEWLLLKWKKERKGCKSLNLVIQRLATAHTNIAVSENVNEAARLHLPWRFLASFILKWPNPPGSPACTGRHGFESPARRRRWDRRWLVGEILGKPEYSTLPRLDIPAANTPPLNHSRSSRAQEETSKATTNYLWGAAHHVLQQLNHFPTSSSRGLFFRWRREIVERLASWDGSTQHRRPWPTLTTNQQPTTMQKNVAQPPDHTKLWEHQEL